MSPRPDTEYSNGSGKLAGSLLGMVIAASTDGVFVGDRAVS